MTDVETSRPTEDLTDTQAEAGVQESSEGSTEPAKDDKVIAGFQKSLQEAREREKDLANKVNEMQSKLKSYERAEQERAEAQMSESEREKLRSERLARENAELKIKMLVGNLARGKNIPAPVMRALEVAPWEMVPQVKEAVGTNPTYDEILDALETHLPDYIESFVVSEAPSKDVGDTPSVEPSATNIDAERASGSSVVKQHMYTRAEVTAMSPEEYEKHRKAIGAQLEANGGTLPE